jgi:DNA-binding transcriptional MerR regulator
MPTDLTLAELSALADVPARTIRFYIAQGLLPAPGREGPATRYPLSALHRLRLIRQLQREHLPLAEIRKRLGPLSDEEIEALAGAAQSEPPDDSALEYVRRVLGSPASVPPAALVASGRLRRSFEPPASRPSPAGAAVASETPPPPAMPAGPVAGSPVADSPSVAPASSAVAFPSPSAAPAASDPSAPSARTRSQWERIVLEPDVELHIRRPSSRITNRRVERLLTFARELLEEDQP